MKYIMTLENYTNRSLLHTGRLGLGLKSGKWKTINIDGLDVKIQPHSYLSKGYDDKIVNDIISRIKSLNNRWKLVGDINLYKKQIYPSIYIIDDIETEHHLKFRLTDVDGDSEYGTDGEIPEDIKSEMIKDINSKLKGYNFDIEEFEDRGYIIIDISLDKIVNESYRLMKYIKEYNSYSTGIEELGSNLWRSLHQVQQKYGYSTFTRRELDFFHKFFIKSDRHDFFQVSGTSKTRRSTFNFRYMPSIDPKNPIKVCIRRLGDDYYYISIEFLTNSQSKYSEYNDSNKPDSIAYLIDNYDDLVDFLKDIDKIHKILDNN